MQLTKNAIGNLINRYKAVLKKCNLMNTFGSLAVAGMLVMGGAGMAMAADPIVIKADAELSEALKDKAVTSTDKVQIKPGESEATKVTSSTPAKYEVKGAIEILGTGEEASGISTLSVGNALTVGGGITIGEIKTGDAASEQAATSQSVLDGAAEGKGVVIGNVTAVNGTVTTTTGALTIKGTLDVQNASDVDLAANKKLTVTELKLSGANGIALDESTDKLEIGSLGTGTSDVTLAGGELTVSGANGATLYAKNADTATAKSSEIVLGNGGTLVVMTAADPEVEGSVDTYNTLTLNGFGGAEGAALASIAESGHAALNITAGKLAGYDTLTVGGAAKTTLNLNPAAAGFLAGDLALKNAAVNISSDSETQLDGGAGIAFVAANADDAVLNVKKGDIKLTSLSAQGTKGIADPSKGKVNVAGTVNLGVASTSVGNLSVTSISVAGEKGAASDLNATGALTINAVNGALASETTTIGDLGTLNVVVTAKTGSADLGNITIAAATTGDNATAGGLLTITGAASAASLNGGTVSAGFFGSAVTNGVKMAAATDSFTVPSLTLSDELTGEDVVAASLNPNGKLIVDSLVVSNAKTVDKVTTVYNALNLTGGKLQIGSEKNAGSIDAKAVTVTGGEFILGGKGKGNVVTPNMTLETKGGTLTVADGSEWTIESLTHTSGTTTINGTLTISSALVNADATAANFTVSKTGTLIADADILGKMTEDPAGTFTFDITKSPIEKGTYLNKQIAVEGTLKVDDEDKKYSIKQLAAIKTGVSSVATGTVVTTSGNVDTKGSTVTDKDTKITAVQDTVAEGQIKGTGVDISNNDGKDASVGIVNDTTAVTVAEATGGFAAENLVIGKNKVDADDITKVDVTIGDDNGKNTTLVAAKEVDNYIEVVGKDGNKVDAEKINVILEAPGKAGGADLTLGKTDDEGNSVGSGSLGDIKLDKNTDGGDESVLTNKGTSNVGAITATADGQGNVIAEAGKLDTTSIGAGAYKVEKVEAAGGDVLVGMTDRDDTTAAKNANKGVINAEKVKATDGNVTASGKITATGKLEAAKGNTVTGASIDASDLAAVTTLDNGNVTSTAGGVTLAKVTGATKDKDGNTDSSAKGTITANGGDAVVNAVSSENVNVIANGTYKKAGKEVAANVDFTNAAAPVTVGNASSEKGDVKVATQNLTANNISAVAGKVESAGGDITAKASLVAGTLTTKESVAGLKDANVTVGLLAEDKKPVAGAVLNLSKDADKASVVDGNLTVQGAKTSVGVLTVNGNAVFNGGESMNADVLTVAGDSRFINQNNADIDTFVAKGDINVGHGDDKVDMLGGTVVKISHLDLAANKSLLVDPAWGLPASKVIVKSFYDSATKKDVDVTGGLIAVGQNAMVTIGDPSVADGGEDWLENQIKAVNGGKGLYNPDDGSKVSAALGIYKPVMLTAGASGITVDGTQTTVGGFTVAPNKLDFAADSLLVVDASAMKDGKPAISYTGTAKVGTASIDDTAKLRITNAEVNNDGYVVLDSKTITAADLADPDKTGWKGTNVTTDNLMVKIDWAEDGKFATKAADPTSVMPGLDGELSRLIKDAYNAHELGGTLAYTGQGGQKFLTRLTHKDFMKGGKEAAKVAEGAARMIAIAGVPQMAMSANNAAAGAVLARTSIGSLVNNVMAMDANGNVDSQKGANAGDETGMSAGNSYAKTGLGMWIMPLWQSTNNFGMDAGNFDMDMSGNLGGVALGIDYTFEQAIRAGITFNIGGGYAEGSGDYAKTENRMNFWGLGAYVSGAFDNFGVTADVNYTSTFNDIKQDLDHRMGMGNLKTDVNASVLSAGLQGEYKFATDMLDIMPHVGVRLTYLSSEDYDVKAGGEKVYKGDGLNQTIWTFPVGVQFSKDIALNNGWYVKPLLDLNVTPAAGEVEAKNDIRFTGVSGTAQMETQVMDYITYGGKAGIEFGNDNVKLGVNYNLQMGAHTANHGVFGTFRYEF